MAKGRRKGRGKAEGTTACIHVVVKRLEEAAAIAAAASALLRQGQDDHAFALALDLEPLMHDANHALQAAFVLRRSDDR